MITERLPAAANADRRGVARTLRRQVDAQGNRYDGDRFVGVVVNGPKSWSLAAALHVAVDADRVSIRWAMEASTCRRVSCRGAGSRPSCSRNCTSPRAARR
jgi:hypothetical protein